MQPGIQGQPSWVGHLWDHLEGLQVRVPQVLAGEWKAHRLSLATNILTPAAVPGAVNDPTFQGCLGMEHPHAGTPRPDW